MSKFAMLKGHLKGKGMVAMKTIPEVALLSGSMILSAKFLSFKELFKDKIAADPKYADKWYIKHEGAIKFLIGVGASVYISNPWLRMIAIGVAITGFIEEARAFAQGEGPNVIPQIGKSSIDQQLDELARRYNQSTSGVISQYSATVAGASLIDQYQGTVAGVPAPIVEYRQF